MALGKAFEVPAGFELDFGKVAVPAERSADKFAVNFGALSLVGQSDAVAGIIGKGCAYPREQIPSALGRNRVRDVCRTAVGRPGRAAWPTRSRWRPKSRRALSRKSRERRTIKSGVQPNIHVFQCVTNAAD